MLNSSLCHTVYYLKKTWWIFIVLLMGFSLPTGAEPTEFRFANLPNTYMSEHVKESRLAMQIILKKVFKSKYPEFYLKLEFLPDNNHLVKTIRQAGYDVLAMTGFDYLKLRKEIKLTPLVILCRSSLPTESLLLMARTGITLESIADNPKRTLLIEGSIGETLANAWLNEVLGNQHLPSYNAMFTTIRSVDKPIRALLPVFFGQADMCIISRTALQPMAKLNPQIMEKLTVVQQSPGFVNMMFCGTDQLKEWAKTMIVKETANTHTSPDGQQALTIIQMNRFIPFKSDYLKATEALYDHSQRTTTEK